MNFHTTTNSRISKMDGTTTVEHRATLHYSDTNCDIRDAVTLDLDKNVEKVRK